MGKGGGGNSSLEAAQASDAQALTQIAQSQQANSQQLFNTTFPGLGRAEDFYSSLSTGDPTQIARAIAPATQQINQATTSAKQNILANSPNGGEKNLALEQADVSQGAQVGNLASSSYLNSFNALAQLAGQGVGESQSASGLALTGYGNAAQTQGNIVQENIQQKGATLGALTSVASDAASLAFM